MIGDVCIPLYRTLYPLSDTPGARECVSIRTLIVVREYPLQVLSPSREILPLYVSATTSTCQAFSRNEAQPVTGAGDVIFILV